MRNAIPCCVLATICSAAAVSLVWLAAVCHAGEARSVASEPSSDAARARAATLVRQLGDPHFAAREQATEQLIVIGIEAAEALEAGVRTDDREVRFRSRRILEIVRELDFQRRLQAFASDSSEAHGHGLPAWDAFRELVGEDADARSLFVEMQRADAELMRAVAAGTDAVQDLVNRRTSADDGALNQLDRAWNDPSAGKTAAYLFALLDDSVRIDSNTGLLLYTYLHDPSFDDAMRSMAMGGSLRKLLGAWLQRDQPELLYQGLLIATKYRMPEGLVAAQRALEMNDSPPALRQQALVVFSMLGNRSHAPLLTSALDDDRPCNIDRDPNDHEVRYETRVGDLALAATLHLLGKDPKAFGFERYQFDRGQINPRSVGFADDESRQQVFRKWRELRLSDDSEHAALPAAERP